MDLESLLIRHYCPRPFQTLPFFSEFNAKSAHVAVRRNGRSLGFGFVEFNNAQDQKNALDALDQSEVNGRVVTIKIASRPSGKVEDNNDKLKEILDPPSHFSHTERAQDLLKGEERGQEGVGCKFV